MFGRIVLFSVGMLLGLSGVQVQAQASIAPSGDGLGCCQKAQLCVVECPRTRLFGPGLECLFGRWWRTPKCPQACGDTCKTCAPARVPACNCLPAKPVCVPSTPVCRPTIVRIRATPTCACSDGVKGTRVPCETCVAMNPVPASGSYTASPYNMVPVFAPKPQQGYSPNVGGGTPPLPTVVISMPPPRGTAEPTLAQPTPAQPASNPYMAFIEAMQQVQEKNSRALQEMVEQRMASQAVIRSMQASDANTAAAFEKLVHQMKEDSSPRIPGAPPAVNVNVNANPPDINGNTIPSAFPASLPAPPASATPVVPVVPPAPPVPAAPKDLKTLLQELEQLSQKVKELSAQVPPRSE